MKLQGAIDRFGLWEARLNQRINGKYLRNACQAFRRENVLRTIRDNATAVGTKTREYVRIHYDRVSMRHQSVPVA